MEQDVYKTIECASEGVYKQLSSKFLAFAYHVDDVDQVKELVQALRTKYYDARHWCYAYRIGFKGEHTRANDDGEPSGTAGRPILGQIMSHELTNVLVVVVRYFGGIKLGVSGLIEAYKSSTDAAIEQAVVVERTKNAQIEVRFPYIAMNSVMRAVKDYGMQIVEQEFDNMCRMRLSVREKLEARVVEQLSDVDSVEVAVCGYN